jgi:hypothetical protein
MICLRGNYINNYILLKKTQAMDPNDLLHFYFFKTVGIIIGILLCFKGIRDYLKLSRFKEEGIETDGTVISFESQFDASDDYGDTEIFFPSLALKIKTGMNL